MSNDVSTVADLERTVACTVTSLFQDVDVRDWNGVRTGLAAHVAVDYTPLWGGEPSVAPADDLIRSWQQVLTGFEATQHLLGPSVVQINDDDATTARIHVLAEHVHRNGNGSWTAGGHYRLRLVLSGDAWRVAGIRLDVHYQESIPKPSASTETSTTN